MNDDRFFSALARRAVLASGLSMALLGLAGSASAQDGGTIRMIVPFGAGTTTDTIGRIVAEALGKNLHANVVVENRAGAGAVLDDHVRMQVLAERFGDDPTDRVGGGAGAERHDHPDGAAVLRGCAACQPEQRHRQARRENRAARQRGEESIVVHADVLAVMVFNAARISSLCSPSVGGGRTSSGRSPSNETGERTVRKRPITGCTAPSLRSSGRSG